MAFVTSVWWLPSSISLSSEGDWLVVFWAGYMLNERFSFDPYGPFLSCMYVVICVFPGINLLSILGIQQWTGTIILDFVVALLGWLCGIIVSLFVMYRAGGVCGTFLSPHFLLMPTGMTIVWGVVIFKEYKKRKSHQIPGLDTIKALMIDSDKFTEDVSAL
jgi:hypothetical protein